MRPLDRSLSSEPPHDLAIERRFLGGLLLSYRRERNDATKWVTRGDFHDPWHEWVFVAIRSGRQCEDSDELIVHLAKCASESPPQLSRPITQDMVSEFVYDRDGMPCGSLAAHMRRYAAELLRLGNLRRKQLELESKLIAILHEADEHDWDDTDV